IDDVSSFHCQLCEYDLCVPCAREEMGLERYGSSQHAAKRTAMKKRRSDVGLPDEHERQSRNVGGALKSADTSSKGRTRDEAARANRQGSATTA
ncbi:unnamed protein product, partial [Amoebophrya sp. A25]